MAFTNLGKKRKKCNLNFFTLALLAYLVILDVSFSSKIETASSPS